MEVLVKSCNICWVWSGMPGHAQRSAKQHQYLWAGLSYFLYLLHVVTHTWKLHCYHVVLVGYDLPCLKFSERTNCQYLEKGLSDFVNFLYVVI